MTSSYFNLSRERECSPHFCSKQYLSMISVNVEFQIEDILNGCSMFLVVNTYEASLVITETFT